MLVSKPTHGGGAPLGIDLDAGVAKIKLTRSAPPAEPTEPVEPVEAPTAFEGAGATAATGPAEDADENGDREPEG